MTVDNTSTEGNTSKSVREPPQIHALPVPPNTAFDSIVDLEETALDEVTGIFSQLTPASLFHEQPNEIYFTLPSTLYHRFRWTAFPDLSQPHSEGRREQFVTVFLNDLRDHCRQWMAARNWPLPTMDRQWLPVVTARLEPDGTQTSMFGIILVQSGAAADWSTALCDVQIVNSADRMPEAVRNLSTTAAYVFAAQDDCLYHIGLAFVGEEFTIVIHDRAGRAQFVRREVHKHGLLLVRLMVALTLVDKTPLGRDPTITRRADGVRLLTVNEVEYEIVDRLFSSAHVRGRGTVCWRCRRPGRDVDYVIKSAWVDRRRTETEASILKRTEGVFGVPSLVDHEIVANADGSRISTHLFRDCLRLLGRQKELQDVEILELHRLVMRPYGIPLTDFRSKEELLSGIRDAVAAHWGLWDDRDILHCDISDNNVLLRGDEPEERLRHGLLIDFDCATHVRGSYKTAPSDHKAGTLPYMSYTALMHPEVPHSRAHDLESFLYVLMWICTSYNGPLRARAGPFDPYQTPIGRWQTSRDTQEVGQQKWDIMYEKSDADFRAFLNETFDPYFYDLKDCVCDIRRVILFNREGVTHEDILDILEVHICAQQPPDRRRQPLKLKPEEDLSMWCMPEPEWMQTCAESLSDEEDDEDEDDTNEARDAATKSGTGNTSLSDNPAAPTPSQSDFSYTQLKRIHPLSVPANTDLGAISDLEESALYDVTSIFGQLTPESLFTGQPNEIYFKMPPTWYNRKLFRWTTFPDLSRPRPDGERERLVAGFLNSLHDHCRQWQAARQRPLPQKTRRWLPTVTARLRPDGFHDSMLGIVLVSAGSAVEWSTTLCDVQIVTSADLMPEAVRNLSATAAYIFASQDNCLYHVGLVFAGEDFTIVIHDRAGRAQFVRRDVHKHAILLVRLMVALTLVDTTPLGRGPVLATRADGTRLLTVNGVEYEVVERLHSTPHVRGGGTVCWRCRRSGSDDDYVIKKAWVDSRRAGTEASILKEVEGVYGVPALVDREIAVDIDGNRISTDQFRKCLRMLGRGKELRDVEMLELHRLVMRPCGVPLTEFRSKEELLSGMRDGVVAHWGLWDDRGILHCDISDTNILLRQDEPEERVRRGLLIDLASATHVSGTDKVAPFGHCVGTVAFVSCTLLLHSDVPHGAAHDLESFLYVLMWICTSYNGPKSSRAVPFDVHQTPMGKWHTSQDDLEIGQQKWEIMRGKSEPEFRAFLDETFDPYFDDLKDCVCELRQAIFFNKDGVTHEDVLDIFELHICAQQPVDQRRPPVKWSREEKSRLHCLVGAKQKTDACAKKADEGGDDATAGAHCRVATNSATGAMPPNESALAPALSGYVPPSIAIGQTTCNERLQAEKRKRESSAADEALDVPTKRRA